MISLQLSCSQFKGRAQKDRPKNTKKYRKPDSREGEGYHNGVLPAGRYHLLEVKQPVYGCTSHLWNRAFCILQAVPAQNVSPAPLPSSVSFSLPESGGKDKKMTNMLMNGAVAIYGGVGVMEIHQPLPQAVESVAQAVDDLAVNAHISLRELKNCVDKVLEKKIPGYKQLMETNPVVAARATVNGATITAYTNGYAVYEADDAHTVLDVNRCGDYRYDFNDGTYEVVPAEVFEDAEWTVRLVMEGERRLENNRSKISRDYEEFALSCDGTDWCDAAMVDFMEAENAEMLADEELRKLYAAMSKLTERQQEVVQLYFYKGLNQYEIAEELGIARRSVGNCLEGALKKIRKYF